jgi:hypothetical protein
MLDSPAPLITMEITMRLTTLAGLAAAAVALAGSLVVASPAQAAALPCWVAGSGSDASAGCYSGSSITWRLAVDCWDTTNIKWPTLKESKFSPYVTGDGEQHLSCARGLRANGRLEVR